MAISDWPKPLAEVFDHRCPIAPTEFTCINRAGELCMIWRAGKMKIDGQEENVGWCGAAGKPEDKYYVGAFVYP